MLVRTRELFGAGLQTSPEGERSSSLRKYEREMNKRGPRTVPRSYFGLGQRHQPAAVAIDAARKFKFQ
jgi:hypothetical protein